MTTTEPELWVPTVNQIIMASQRTILAALDVNLLLAQRTLQAEHAAELSGENLDVPSPPHLALTQSILIMTATLRELIARYHTVIENMLGDT